MSGSGVEPELRRILVVKLADLGDALLATPAIRALGQTYPDARLDALTTPTGAGIFSYVPELDRVIEFPKQLFDEPRGMLRPDRAGLMGRLALELRTARYDAVVLLHHLTTRFGAAKFRALCLATRAPVRAGLDNGAGNFLTHRAVDYGFGARTEWEYGLDVVATLGATTDATRPGLEIPESADRMADRLLAARGVRGPFVVIHPAVGGFSPGRAWPVERFGAVAREIQDRTGAQIVLVGAANEAEAGRRLVEELGAVDLMGATTVATLAATLRRAALVIGSDSGVVQMAAAVGAPTLAIFGFTNPEAWRPYGAAIHQVGARPLPRAPAIALRAAIPCSPCFYTGYSLGRRDGCALKTCLDMVTVAEVVAAAEHLLGASGEVPASPRLTGQ